MWNLMRTMVTVIALVIYVAGAYLHDVTAQGCPATKLYPYGSAVGDASEAEADDGMVSTIIIGQSLPFYGDNYTEFGLNANGFIRLGYGKCDCCCGPDEPENFPFIALFWADHDLEINGILYYRKVDLVEEPEVIKNVEDDAAAIGVHLTPTFVFIATWENASAYSGEIWETNTYQLVLASDGFKTVTIFNYGRIQWQDDETTIGFNKGDEVDWVNLPTMITAESGYMTDYSSTGRRGQIVARVDLDDLHDHFPESPLYRLDINCDYLPDVTDQGCHSFYPYGSTVGDTTETDIDDITISPITIGQSLPFYGNSYSEFGLNTNGFIRLGDGTCRCCCGGHDEPKSYPYIALFWEDHDVEVNGTLYYRKVDLVQEPEVIDKVTDDAAAIGVVDLTPTFVFIATWEDTAKYGGDPLKTNTYQLVLASDGFKTVTIFNYGVIQWEDYGATIGFNKGDEVKWVDLPTILGESSFFIGAYSNTGRRGQIVVRVDQDDLQDQFPDTSLQRIDPSLVMPCYVCNFDLDSRVVTTFEGSTDLSMNVASQKFLFSKTPQSGPFGSQDDQCKFMMRIVTDSAGAFEWLGFSVGIHPTNAKKYKRNIVFDASSVEMRGHNPTPVGQLPSTEHITDKGQDLVIHVEQTTSGTGWIVRSPNCSYVMTFDPNRLSNQIQLNVGPDSASHLIGMCQFVHDDGSDDLLDCSRPPTMVTTVAEVQSSCDCDMAPNSDKACMKAHLAL